MSDVMCRADVMFLKCLMSFFLLFVSLIFALAKTLCDRCDPIVAFFLWKNKTGVHHLDRALLRFCAVATESAVWPSLCVAVSAGLFFSHNVSASSPQTNKSDDITIYLCRRPPTV
jgi:hypothetical protein